MTGLDLIEVATGAPARAVFTTRRGGVSTGALATSSTTACVSKAVASCARASPAIPWNTQPATTIGKPRAAEIRTNPRVRETFIGAGGK